mmetsp:Transcript_16325/g.30708  ORF Transcript_16325/g.30708 Transcript_16325/m.30708 type:complete len:189 (-) Transcript_16325:235-801(-)
MAEGDKQSKMFLFVASVVAALLLLMLGALAMDISHFVKGVLAITFAASSGFLLARCFQHGSSRVSHSPKPADTCSLDCVVAACSYGSLAASPPEFHLCSLDEDGVMSSTGTQVASVPPTRVCPSQTTCICCLEDFEEDSKVAVTMCGHVFHEDCLASWLLARPGARSCPTCRAALLPSVMSAGVEFTV